MAENNGQQDNLSRLDRIEAAMEHMTDEHELFRVEHKALLRSQVLLQDSLERLKDLQERAKEEAQHSQSRLDAVVNMIDRDHREFHERLKRLEEKQ